MPRQRFPPFEADLSSCELWRDGVAVPIQDLPFRLLVLLLERPGEVVSREAIVERLWGKDTFVDATAGVNTAIAKLREALGDSAESPSFVETLPRRGYRFVAPVEPAIPAKAAGSSARRRRLGGLVAVLGGAIAIGATLLVAPRQDDPNRVAVILFDNETGNAAWDRRAQNLTDATVGALTEVEGLEVIGNAAVLRTPRPFRDLQDVQRKLGAGLVVIGQVQRVDDSVLVRCHLIRTRDQAHVWFRAFAAGDGEAALQDEVAAEVARAVRSERSNLPASSP